MPIQMLKRAVTVAVPSDGREAFRRDLPNVAARAMMNGLLISLAGQLVLHLGGTPTHLTWVYVASHIGLLSSLVVTEFAGGQSPVRLLAVFEIACRVLVCLVAFSAGLGDWVGVATAFTIFIVAANAFNSLSQPFLSTIYGIVYTSAHRGKIIAYTRMIHGIVSMVAAYGFGVWLRDSPMAFQIIYPIVGVLGIAATAYFCTIPARPEFSLAPSHRRFAGLTVLWRNREFGKFQFFQFILGVANLSAMPVLALYVQDELKMPIDLAVLIVANGVIADGVTLFTVRVHGMLFDRLGVVAHRVLTSGFFAVAFLVWSVAGANWWLAVLAAGLMGLGRSGGQIIWMIGSTYFAPTEELGAYNSAHTFLTGVRGFAAPFVGAWVITASPIAGNYPLFFQLAAAVIFISAIGHALFVRVPKHSPANAKPA